MTQVQCLGKRSNCGCSRQQGQHCSSSSLRRSIDCVKRQIQVHLRITLFNQDIPGNHSAAANLLLRLPAATTFFCNRYLFNCSASFPLKPLVIISNTHHHFLRDILIFCQTRWGGTNGTTPGCLQWDGRGDDDDGRGQCHNDYDFEGRSDILIAHCHVVNAEARPCKQSCPRWWRTYWGRGAASPSSTAVAILLPLLAPSRIRLSSSLFS